jgi:hypothetical protein
VLGHFLGILAQLRVEQIDSALLPAIGPHYQPEYDLDSLLMQIHGNEKPASMWLWF